MNYTTQLYPDLTPEERYNALQNAAYKQEKDIVKRQFTPEELVELKKELSSNTVAIDDQEEMKAALVKPINEEIKNLKGVKKELIKKVKNGYDKSEEDTFMFDDQENKVMYIYDADGILLSQRPLTKNERQTNIRTLNTGTNG